MRNILYIVTISCDCTFDIGKGAVTMEHNFIGVDYNEEKALRSAEKKAYEYKDSPYTINMEVTGIRIERR